MKKIIIALLVGAVGGIGYFIYKIGLATERGNIVWTIGKKEEETEEA